MADHAARLPPEAGEAADDRGVVAKLPVAVHFSPVLEQAGDEVEGIGPLRMTRHQGLLPRREIGVNLIGDFDKLVVKLRDPAGVTLRRGGFLDLAPELEDGLFELRRVAVHGA